jgi:hypothetical protein
MKIELKSIKYAAFASQETSCYSATLWVDGVKIGTVENDGHGGCDSFWGDQQIFDKANAWCKENLPKWDGYDGEPHDTDLEMHCGTLLVQWLCRRDLKRLMAKKVVFKTPDGMYEVAHKGNLNSTVARMRDKYPDAQILNTMAFDDALEIFMKET